jgi:hypothetical protein
VPVLGLQAEASVRLEVEGRLAASEDLRRERRHTRDDVVELDEGRQLPAELEQDVALSASRRADS